MILACHNISKAFGEQVIVKSGSFHIEDREKTALIGPNGAGKSTILKMIMKELDTDSGDIILTKGKTIGYLSQHQELSSGNTILEELKTAKADIIAGKQKVFTGPLYDQSGTEKVPAGTTLTDKELLSMDWFVKGVDGKIQN